LREAKENSEKLATIADEAAAKKENTDEVVQNLQDAKEELYAQVAKRIG
jgi:hypothetical protein